LPPNASAEAAEALKFGIFGPLDANPQGRIEEEEEEDAEGEEVIEEEVSRKRPQQQLSNGSPVKRQRLSNGLENGAEAPASVSVPASAPMTTSATGTGAAAGTAPTATAAPAPVTRASLPALRRAPPERCGGRPLVQVTHDAGTSAALSTGQLLNS
jgi:transducin (beta)-like 1